MEYVNKLRMEIKIMSNSKRTITPGATLLPGDIELTEERVQEAFSHLGTDLYKEYKAGNLTLEEATKGLGSLVTETVEKKGKLSWTEQAIRSTLHSYKTTELTTEMLAEAIGWAEL